MLGSNAMTRARIATARRQIANNASQSRGRNRPSGDAVSRRPAAETVIGHPLEEWILGTFRLVRPAQAESGLTRSVHPRLYVYRSKQRGQAQARRPSTRKAQ